MVTKQNKKEEPQVYLLYPQEPKILHTLSKHHNTI